jgi:hypothetical protein
MQHRPQMLTMPNTARSNAPRPGISIQIAADALISRLDDLLVKNKRFIVLEKGEAIPPKKAKQLWGVLRTWPEYGRVLAIDLRRLQRLVPIVSLPRVLHFLVRQGVVLPGMGGVLTRQLMIDGWTGSRRRRYVVFVEKALVERAGILAREPMKI